MINEFATLLLAILLAPFGTPAESAPSDAPPPAIVLVGDSITDMHRSTLTEVADACDTDIALHSQSSRRIADSYELDGRWVNSGLDEIDRIRATQDPTTWIIELGTNDLPNITEVDDARTRIDAVLARLDDGDRVIWTTVLFPFRGSDAAVQRCARRHHGHRARRMGRRRWGPPRRCGPPDRAGSAGPR